MTDLYRYAIMGPDYCAHNGQFSAANIHAAVSIVRRVVDALFIPPDAPEDMKVTMISALNETWGCGEHVAPGIWTLNDHNEPLIVNITRA